MLFVFILHNNGARAHLSVRLCNEFTNMAVNLLRAITWQRTTVNNSKRHLEREQGKLLCMQRLGGKLKIFLLKVKKLVPADFFPLV